MTNWYYVANDTQQGPFPEDRFLQLVKDGTITPNTLVWHDQMDDWKELREIQPTLKTQEAVTPFSESAACDSCGKRFPKKEMLQYDNSWICAGCKPEFTQKLKEGIDLGIGSYTYAGFWRRFAAVFLDGIIMAIVQWAFTLIGMLIPGVKEGAGIGIIFNIFSMLAQFILPIVYEVYFISEKGATPGKMALGIKVITADGGAVSSGLALGRYFAKILSAIILCIGYLMIVFNDEKKALHDHICDTRVILN